MRIAWLTPYVPWPENSGGRIRIGQLARALSSHSLHLFCTLGSDDRWDALPKSWDPWSTIHIVPRSPTRSFLYARQPFTVRAFPVGLWDAISETHRSDPFDVVIVEHCYAGRDIAPLPGAIIVLNEHNVESLYWRHLLELRPWSIWKSGHMLRIWRNHEVRLWRQVSHVTAVSEADAKEIGKHVGTVDVFPNGIDIDRYHFRLPSERVGNGILFVGMMSYDPNVEAALHLAHLVMPLVRRQVPDASLTIAGRDPRPQVQNLANDHVRVTGTLSDVSALFNDHAAYAMPLGTGAGTSLKVLEPLAAGVPLVATTFAVRGYGLESNRDFRAARSVEEQADALVDVLQQRAQFDEMARSGRRFAESFSWQQIGRRYHEWLCEKVVSGAKPDS